MSNRLVSRVLPLTAALALAACSSSEPAPDETVESGGLGLQGPQAQASILPSSNSGVTGRALFTEGEDGTWVEVWVNGATPGKHAVHVHEVGDCSAPDGTSAGGHFNPDGVDHGGPRAGIHHAGDLGNMYVEADGSGYHRILSYDLTVRPGEHSVVGRAIIVHADADDLISQPTGNAGGRIGCGVIE